METKEKIIGNRNLNSFSNGGEKSSDRIAIFVADEDKIDRKLLNPPSKSGDAPTFKSDGTKVELHKIGHSPEGPFKEMHWYDHRGKENFKKNHPGKERT